MTSYEKSFSKSRVKNPNILIVFRNIFEIVDISLVLIVVEKGHMQRYCTVNAIPRRFCFLFFEFVFCSLLFVMQNSYLIEQEHDLIRRPTIGRVNTHE